MTNPPRILVVDDQPVFANDIQQQLVVLGYEPVGRATRGEQAIELAGQLHPDLVLIDVRLAGSVDGIAAAQTIRSRFSLPVVLLAAHAEEDLLARAKQPADVAVDGEVEMRDRTLGFGQALCDDAPRVRVREVLVGRPGGRRCVRRGAGTGGGLHVGLEHAAVGSRSGHAGQVDVEFFGDAPRERACEHAPGARDRSSGRRGRCGRGRSGRGWRLNRSASWLLRRCCGRLHMFSLAGEQRDHRGHLHAVGSFRDQDAAEHAVLLGLDFDHGLVGFDLEQNLALLDRIAFLLGPADDVALGHGRRHGRDQDFCGHADSLTLRRHSCKRAGRSLCPISSPDFGQLQLRNWPKWGDR